jgi:hypothetical protein
VRVRNDDDDLRDAPPAVIGAVAVGVAPLPFLAIYALLFIVHGWIHPVAPPDITTTRGGELVAGLIALALFVLGSLSVLWLVNGRRRWLFVLGQAATLGTGIDFLIDRTSGAPGIPILLCITSLVALVLAFTPQAAQHMRRPLHLSQFLRRVPGQADSGQRA